MGITPGSYLLKGKEGLDPPPLLFRDALSTAPPRFSSESAPSLSEQRMRSAAMSHASSVVSMSSLSKACSPPRFSEQLSARWQPSARISRPLSWGGLGPGTHTHHDFHTWRSTLDPQDRAIDQLSAACSR